LSDDERKELRAYPADRAGGDLGRPASGEREQADIARLLRALNDDLRDDPPPREAGSPASPPPQQQPPLRGPGRRPSLLLVGVGIIAAAAIGLGSLLFTGSGPSPAPGRVISARPGGDETPPALIARAGGDASAPAVSGPITTGVAPFVPSAPVVVAPSQVPASPRLLTPGQTATIVRPAPVEPPPSPAETPSSGGATVVVQPLAPAPAVSAPAAPVASPPPAAPRVVASPSPKPVPTTPAKPAPAPVPAPASAGAVPGGPGHWAVQVGTFSVAGNAEQLVRKLGQNGRAAYVVEWQDRQGRTWKAVRVGNFTSEAAARAAVDELKTRMDLTGQLINLR
jgi:septal ring-binding cell division protein DamX